MSIESAAGIPAARSSHRERFLRQRFPGVPTLKKLTIGAMASGTLTLFLVIIAGVFNLGATATFMMKVSAILTMAFAFAALGVMTGGPQPEDE